MAAGVILIPVAKQILGKAAELAAEQIGLLRNFRRELEKFKDTVSTIQAVLHDAEEKQFHNHQVKDWLEKLSDVMYDAEDLLDDLATEARRKAVLAAADDDDGGGGGGRRRTAATTCWSVVCFLFSSLTKQLAYDLKMAHDIKAIREKLDDISKDKDGLHLEVGNEIALPSGETDSCPPMIVVGREEDKKNVIHLLLNSNCEANISVVTIVGMGGMGKTTLAQLVFDDDRVRAHFDVKAWVYVSQNFDGKAIIGKMLRSMNCGGQADPDLDVVQTRLREEIKGKRFLFVLDDVWKETTRSWETLGKYLTIGAPGSKVLVTTRSTKVAEVGGGALKSETSISIVEAYQLEGLSEEECWNLLVKKALPRKMPRDPQVQQIGKQILRTCYGVPLAVSTIAAVLVDSRDPRTEWPSILQKASITKKGEEDPTMSSLQLSFNYLPSHMKHCFTYCKLFQKDYRFKIPMLVQLWVAQGYIESEDEGFNSFKTLWWRLFFQEVEMDKLGNMSTCRMHDLMHDLAGSIAGEKIIRSSSSTILKNIPSKTRHLLITGDGDDYPREEDYDGHGLGNATKVRTLICGKTLSNKELEQVLNNFLCLRVLIIVEEESNLDGEESFVLNASTSLNVVDKLKHLRYLGFKSTVREKLPDSITNLVNLQVLDLNDCTLLEELPRNINRLISLKHLNLHPRRQQYLTHIPKEIGELKFLQTLPIFALGKRSGSSNGEMVRAGLDELKGLNALGGKLNIKGLADAESPRNGGYVLKEKLHLQSLVLNWGRDDDSDDDATPLSTHDEEILEMFWPHHNLKKLMILEGYEGLKLPNWLSSLTNLVEFSLKDCKRCEYLPPLHQMSSLKKLTIDNCPMLKGINNDGDHCDVFPDKLTRIVTKEEGDDEWPRFHCLSYLRIQDCRRLTRLPTFPTVEGWMDLKNVSLTPFAKTMKMKLRRGGEGGIDYSNDYAFAYDDTNIHPLSKLTKLTLSNIDDDLESLVHPDSSSCLISLQELTVSDCGRCVKLPGSLCSSIYLTEIYISDCETLQYLPSLYELPSLRVLILEHCPKLKGCWWNKNKKKKKKKGNIIDSHNHFPCLSDLVVTWCPKLTQMPLFPTVEGRLSLVRTTAEALVQTMTMNVVVAAAATSHHHDAEQHSTIATTTTTTSPPLLRTTLVTPLSKLTELHLEDIDDLVALPEEGLRNLTSLEKLEIHWCPSLAFLPPAMRYLTSLQSLKIRSCGQLKESCRKGAGKDWPNISHIPYIQLDGEILQDTAEGKC